MAKKITEIELSQVSGNGIIGEEFPKFPSGFYYDQELNNPLTRVTLHANKKYTGKNDNIDGPWTQVPDPDDEICKYSDNDKWHYSLTPIATSIFAEDFSFDIANTFADFGGDPIGDLWNSGNATAPYKELVANALKTIAGKTKLWADETGGGNIGTKGADMIAKIADLMGTGAKVSSALHNRLLHVNGTQFNYFTGTGISFNNMSMKFTILSDWEGDTFVSSVDKLMLGDWPLLAYVIGDYLPVNKIGSSSDKETNKKAQELETMLEPISEYASWQLPPGGFRANLKNVDVINEGTLKLRFGPYFSIPNLIISGCSITLSKEMVRNPSASGDQPKIVPMACDVTLQFKPAANFSKTTLSGVLAGNAKYITDVVEKKMNFNNV